MPVVILLALFMGYEAGAQTTFSEYKPYLPHSRDSFMVFSEKLLNPAINGDIAIGNLMIDSLTHSRGGFFTPITQGSIRICPDNRLL